MTVTVPVFLRQTERTLESENEVRGRTKCVCEMEKVREWQREGETEETVG